MTSSVTLELCLRATQPRLTNARPSQHAMAANRGVLAGKTLFISGASRGIGKAIALKAAKDGANVVIAAKTATAHPKLPGTIYTAAEEIKQAGGEALPCVVDIRNEEQVRSTVDEAVKKFGGIDILVNNASAISLTPTLKTPMKTYDLMNGINARGTYLCSQACLPHLLKAENPHILNISPPLNLNPKWFKGHVAKSVNTLLPTPHHGIDTLSEETSVKVL
ncbi:hypothetical protein RRG08_024975 [Elysia crispata]|uniref:Hydroxysteroid dehydrogenase-like protein 2 n=1 Tax=Elysia crispata TaxID=231223 RepID=A0AAE1ASM5_9GAST|nr:hypothetical protein RRG08_024975 [Elysia crispata]